MTPINVTSVAALTIATTGTTVPTPKALPVHPPGVNDDMTGHASEHTNTSSAPGPVSISENTPSTPACNDGDFNPLTTVSTAMVTSNATPNHPPSPAPERGAIGLVSVMTTVTTTGASTPIIYPPKKLSCPKPAKADRNKVPPKKIPVTGPLSPPVEAGALAPMPGHNTLTVITVGIVGAVVPLASNHMYSATPTPPSGTGLVT